MVATRPGSSFAAVAFASNVSTSTKAATKSGEKKPAPKEDPETREAKDLRNRLRKEHAEKTKRQLAKAEAKANKKTDAKEQDMWNSSKTTAGKAGRRK